MLPRLRQRVKRFDYKTLQASQWQPNAQTKTSFETEIERRFVCEEADRVILRTARSRRTRP